MSRVSDERGAPPEDEWSVPVASAERDRLGVGRAAIEVWRRNWGVAHDATDAGRCGQSLWRDDGIQLFAGVALLAHAGIFLGTQTSNVGRANCRASGDAALPAARVGPAE